MAFYFFPAYHRFLCLWFENGLNAFSISHFNIFFFTRFSSEVYYSRGLTFNSFFETSNFVSYRLLRALHVLHIKTLSTTKTDTKTSLFTFICIRRNWKIQQIAAFIIFHTLPLSPVLSKCNENSSKSHDKWPV